MTKQRWKRKIGITEAPICEICNERPCKKHGKRKDGSIYWKNHCSRCDELKYKKKYRYKKAKQKICSICNFIPKHSCQLDVDHIDGNHDNNDPSNLQTLCANCHRLKTFLKRQITIFDIL